MTKVIRKYVDEGVLNYIDHETPRHYFLYDGVMEEQNASVHRLVEDLCDENIALQQQIKNMEKTLVRLNQQNSEMGWRLNPDRMGGQFTDWEINRRGDEWA